MFDFETEHSMLTRETANRRLQCKNRKIEPQNKKNLAKLVRKSLLCLLWKDHFIWLTIFHFYKLTLKLRKTSEYNLVKMEIYKEGIKSELCINDKGWMRIDVIQVD